MQKPSLFVLNFSLMTTPSSSFLNKYILHAIHTLAQNFGDLFYVFYFSEKQECCNHVTHF